MATTLSSTLFGLAAVALTGVLIHREFKERHREELQHLKERERNELLSLMEKERNELLHSREWGRLYAKCCKKRDAISLLLAHDRNAGDLGTLPLAMARAFEEKQCSNPARVKEEDRPLCELLQDFRRCGRNLMAEAQAIKGSGDLQLRQYQEAANILLPVMALDAANAKVILKDPIKLDGFGPILLLLLRVEDLVTINVITEAYVTTGTMPWEITYVLQKAEEYQRTIQAVSVTRVLGAFVELARRKQKNSAKVAEFEKLLNVFIEDSLQA